MANAFLLLSPVDFLGWIDEDPSVDTHLDTHLNLSIITRQQSEPFRGETWCKEMDPRTKEDETCGTRIGITVSDTCVFSPDWRVHRVCVCDGVSPSLHPPSSRRFPFGIGEEPNLHQNDHDTSVLL